MHQLYLKGKDVSQSLTVADMEGVGSDADLEAWRIFGQRYAILPSMGSRFAGNTGMAAAVDDAGEEPMELRCWPHLEFFGLTFLKHRIKSPTRPRLAGPGTEKAILAMMTQIRPEVEIRLDQGLFNELFSMS